MRMARLHRKVINERLSSLQSFGEILRLYVAIVCSCCGLEDLRKKEDVQFRNRVGCIRCGNKWKFKSL